MSFYQWDSFMVSTITVMNGVLVKDYSSQWATHKTQCIPAALEMLTMYSVVIFSLLVCKNSNLFLIL